MSGFADYLKQHTNAGRMVGKYQRYRDHHNGIPGAPPAAAYGAANPAGSMTNYPQPDPFDGAVGAPQSDMSGPQEQEMAGGNSPEGPPIESYGAGKLVTHPTVARLGEAGPEMVIPLNGKPGNHTRPDLLEGHLAQPQIKGVRYQRYRGFANKAY